MPSIINNIEDDQNDNIDDQHYEAISDLSEHLENLIEGSVDTYDFLSSDEEDDINDEFDSTLMPSSVSDLFIFIEKDKHRNKKYKCTECNKQFRANSRYELFKHADKCPDVDIGIKVELAPYLKKAEKILIDAQDIEWTQVLVTVKSTS